MNIGSLYQLKKYYWLLYPSMNLAAVGAARAPPAAANAASAAAYWSKRLNCNVSYIAKNSIFMLLEQDGEYCRVLTTNGELGWIIYPENEEWIEGCIEEMKTE
jgi:hypothetical protein